MWQIRAARPQDLPSIKELVASVGGDHEDLQACQFVVAEDEAGNIIGCGRLKPYPDCMELASIAVREEWRASGVGRKIVARLLESYSGPLYLICEDDVVEFFRRFGFRLVPPSDMPAGLAPKWRWYVTELGHINVMRRW